MKKITVLFLLSTLWACAEQKDAASENQVDYLSIGDSVATQVQQTLLFTVAQQIKTGGVPSAVTFCSDKALPLTDSLAIAYNVSIKRLSEKNRNPNNAIETDLDKLAWEKLQLLNKDSAAAKQLLLQDNDKVVYYKAIPLAMPTCLSCHGVKNVDIQAVTADAIHQKYPQDKAWGYTIGDLRGMWKITFSE